MCELFGISGTGMVRVNSYLKTLALHSIDHPNGWGIAVFYENAVNLEKEPLPAYRSNYLKERLQHTFEAQNLFAHIRFATKGTVAYENCHPFVKRDVSGRVWTLMHNGTIFDCERLNRYIHKQKGSTDSERIMLYLMDCINSRIGEVGRDLTMEERFEVVDRLVGEITPPNNKVNLMVFDNEMMYVHTNMQETLYYLEIENGTMFATVPLDAGEWKQLPMNTLLGYWDGKRIFEGTNHGNEYIYDPEDMKFLYLDQVGL